LISLGLCSALIAGTAAAADPNPPSQKPSEPQAYCVNRNAEFYPYEGKPCKDGYQVGPGNCRTSDGHLAAIKKPECLAAGGAIELPSERPVIETPVPVPVPVPK